MRRAALLCMTAALSAALLSGCSGGMRADLTATQAAKEMGVGIDLGNTMEAFWQDENDLTAGAATIGDDTPQDYEKCWGAVVTTQECIDGIAAAGFRCVRLPVYWGNMMEDDGKYDIDPAYMARVQEIVDYCLKDDLYVILNIHHYDEFLIKHHTKDETLADAAHVWAQIADRFKSYGDRLVFEGYNEALGTPQEGTTMTEDETYAYVNEMDQVFVDTVRASGGISIC